MRKTNHEKSRLSLILISIIILCLLVFSLTFLKSPDDENGSDLEEGIAFLESMENKDIAKINSLIMAEKTTENETIIVINPTEDSTENPSEADPAPETPSESECEPSNESPTESEAETTSPNEALLSSLKSQIDSAQITILSDAELAAYRNRLSGCAIIGDSMTEAVLKYGLLDSAHVFYRRGFAIGQLGDAINEAAAMYPSTVVFFTGLNDTDYYPEIADYAHAYLEKVVYLQNLLPDAKIYVCSMLPPSNALGAVRPDLARAPYYTQALKDMCNSQGINYIDTTWMVNQSLYMADGIHFIPSFYDIWIQYITLCTGL